MKSMFAFCSKLQIISNPVLYLIHLCMPRTLTTVHSFNKHLVRAYYVPGIVLSSKNMVRTKHSNEETNDK